MTPAERAWLYNLEDAVTNILEHRAAEAEGHMIQFWTGFRDRLEHSHEQMDQDDLTRGNR